MSVSPEQAHVPSTSAMAYHEAMGFQVMVLECWALSFGFASCQKKKGKAGCVSEYSGKDLTA